MKIKICANDNCAIEFSGRSKRSNLYCSQFCSGEARRIRKIQTWLNDEWNGSTDAHGELSPSIKTYLIEQAGFKCTECGWDKINPTTGKCPLEIDHIDGNSTNNHRSNLKVLCRNCHALTPTFKSLNKTGRGSRHYRKKYDQYNLIGRVEADPARLICACGKKKSAQSKRCLGCKSSERKKATDSSYPPIEEILQKVEKIGYVAYGKIIGKSDNAIRKHLIKNGFDPKKPKVLVTCRCGKEIEDRTYLNNFTTCSDHRLKKIKYPPVEDIIEGIQKFGIVEYARMNDIKYASNIRKYLKRNGIELSTNQRIK